MTGRSATSILLAAAALAMAGGGALGLRPFLFRQKIALVSMLPDTPEGREARRGVDLAIEENGFRAGRLHASHEAWPAPAGQAAGSPYVTLPGAPSLPGAVLIPGLHQLHLPRLEPDGPDRFRAFQSKVEDGARAAKWAAAHGIRSVYVVTVPVPQTDFIVESGGIIETIRLDWPWSWVDNPGPSLDPGSAFLEAARARGLSVAGAEPFPGDDVSRRRLAARAARWKTDLVYADVPGASGALVRDLRAKGHRGRIMLSARSVEPDFLKVAGRAANGVAFTAGVLPPPPPEFAVRYRARYGSDPTPYSHAGYLLCRHLLDALDRARASTPADVGRILGEIPAPAWILPAPGAVYSVREGRVVRSSHLP